MGNTQPMRLGCPHRVAVNRIARASASRLSARARLQLVPDTARARCDGRGLRPHRRGWPVIESHDDPAAADVTAVADAGSMSRSPKARKPLQASCPQAQPVHPAVRLHNVTVNVKLILPLTLVQPLD